MGIDTVVQGKNTPDPLTKHFDQLAVELLATGYALHFSAQGTSMSPLIQSGDMVQVEPLDSRMIQLSDVVLFLNNKGFLVLHRVIGIRHSNGFKYFLTKGDQAKQPDGYIEMRQIKGKLTAIERNGESITFRQPVFKMANWLAMVRSRNPRLAQKFLPQNARQWLKTTVFKKYTLQS
jgi:signal peptidase I